MITTLQIDEQGFVCEQNQIIGNQQLGRHILEQLFLRGSQVYSRWDDGSERLIEAFACPLVGQQIELTEDLNVRMTCPYGMQTGFALETLSLDPFDRFRGFTKAGVPFVLNAQAQDQLFNLTDQYDDESITIHGQMIPTPSWYIHRPEVASVNFWSQRYQEGSTSWDLRSPAPALRDFLPKLKVPRSRILVMGAGSGHDAALLAQAGHLVTAVDFAPEAIAMSRQQFAGVANLEFVEADCFALDREYEGNFDIVFEHTFFCAITPEQRRDLIKIWARVLAPGGQLLAIFFVHPLRNGPPFGVSEWEVRAYLQGAFRVLNWQRIRSSVPSRLGNELWVHAVAL